jgi:CRP/FNR family transcriptional regulator
MTNPHVCIEDLFRVHAFRDLAAQDLECLARAMLKRHCEAGQLIFLEGDAAQGLWFVTDGRVRIVKQSLNGRMQTLCLLNRGRCFGTCPLFSDDVNPASAEAVETTTLIILPQSAYRRIHHDCPNLAATLLQVYSQRITQLVHLSETLGTWSTADRINNCLLTYAEQNTPHPTVRLTHEELAVLAGTVREVVTRHLAQLEKSGVVHLEPKLITLLESTALQDSWLCRACARA